MHPLLEITARTLLVGSLAALVCLPPALLCGRWLSRARFRGRSLIQTLLVLPMFVPPVAVGFVLLLLFAPEGPLGGWGGAVLFQQSGAVIAAAVVAFPLLVRHCETAFAAVPVRYEQVAATLGASRWRIFWTVTLPLARRGVVYGLLLAFARALGEFGATSVVAGVVPGHTETLATGMMARMNRYDHDGALAFAGVSVLLGFAAVWLSKLLLREGEEG